MAVGVTGLPLTSRNWTEAISVNPFPSCVRLIECLMVCDPCVKGPPEKVMNASLRAL
jgi:hypothetical protein